MNLNPKLETLGAALSEPARVTMVCELMDGRAYTSSELAAHAGITAQTASAHLGRLRDAGVIVSQKSGRSVYHRIAGEEVAALLEEMSRFTTTDHLYRAGCKRGAQVLVARSCYNHLAGRLGVALAQALEACGALRPDGQELQGCDHTVWGLLGVKLTAQKPAVKRCLDWTERRMHLSGPLATAILEAGVQRGWLERGSSRALRITPDGAAGYQRALGIDMCALKEHAP